MIKTRALSALAALAFVMSVSAAFAQQPATVGDLIGKGGKKLTKEQLSALLKGGATVSGVQEGSGARFSNTLNADGSVKGTAVRTGGDKFELTGKWSVNDKGQLCSDLTPGWGRHFDSCNFFFILDNAHYASQSDEKTAAVMVREIKKK